MRILRLCRIKMTTQPNPPDNGRVALTYLRARNFRSLHDLRLDMGPGVIMLAGPNASGKSNIIDAMSFVGDALYDGVARATGSRGAKALLHRHRGHVSRSFGIGLGFESSSFVAHYDFKVGFQQEGEVSILAEKIDGETKGSHKRKFNFSLRNGEFFKPKHANVSKTLTDFKYSSDTLMLSVMGDSPVASDIFTSALMGNDATADEKASVAQAVVDMTEFIGDMRFYHLFPNVMRPPTQIMFSDNLEEDGSNLASVLHRMTKVKGTAYNQLLSALTHVVDDVEDIRVRETGGYHYIQLKHRSISSNAGGSGWLDLANESDGTVRTLGFFAALYQDPPPNLVSIEEPELTVHVGTLGVIADTLNEAKSRSQIVVTTHSADLLDYFHEESIRAVANQAGRTNAGRIRDAQATALKQALLTAGEIHRMEGLSLNEGSDETVYNPHC